MSALIESAAIQVLRENWRGTYTVPARGLYPHQWSWDSAFIAIGLRHLSPRRAQLELESILSAQWQDGRLPQIVFSSADDGAYSPGPGFWRSQLLPGSPSLPTAGLIQPPNHALAALLVHEANPEESHRNGFLDRVYPSLAAWHRYLRTRRATHGIGLELVHPWETGMDNSPSWDAPIERVPGVPIEEIERPDLLHAEVSERPSNQDYSRYLGLAAAYRDCGLDDTNPSLPFRVVDPATTALWAESERALGIIARAIGQDAVPHEQERRRIVENLEAQWVEHLGCYAPIDVLTGRAIEHRTVSGLIPLMLADIPHSDDLLRTLRGPGFRLGHAVMVPSYDLEADDVDLALYWRGPSWFNTAWLLMRGLRTHGAHEEANALAEQLVRHAGASEFAEYVDPLTGAAHGSRAFSWTAALALDVIRSEETGITASYDPRGRR